jgi:hypothetical protein
MPPITIELPQHGAALALEVVDRRDPATLPPSTLDERITAALAGAGAALPFAKLRAGCRVRANALSPARRARLRRAQAAGDFEANDPDTAVALILGEDLHPAEASWSARRKRSRSGARSAPVAASIRIVMPQTLPPPNQDVTA